MDVHELKDRLARAERALDDGRGLRGSGFWPAVAVMRQEATLADAHADRVAAIDRRAFEQAIALRTSPRLGLAALTAGTVSGLSVLAVAIGVDGHRQIALLLLAWGLLHLSTHSLAHWIVGRRVGIRFTHVFVGHLPEPFPGVKIDYATYLRCPPRARALMHASGALVSKLVPFVVLAAGAAMDAPRLAIQILLVAAVVGLILDVVGWFVASSDWKKVRRELIAARTRGKPRDSSVPVTYVGDGR